MVKRTVLVLPRLATPALAQQPAPTVEQVTKQAQGLIAAVRSQRDAALDQPAQAQAQIAELSERLKAAEAPKPADPPKPEKK